MKLLVTFSIDGSINCISHAFDVAPGTELELLAVTTDTEDTSNPPLGTTLYLWVDGHNPAEFIRALKYFDGGQRVSIVQEDTPARLISVWIGTPSVLDSFYTLAEQCERVWASGSRSGWIVECIGEDHDVFASFRASLAGAAFKIAIESVEQVIDVHPDRELTETQAETLQVALEQGYFESPRQVTQAELGEEFGVSAKAIGKRLRAAEKKTARYILDQSKVGEL